MQPVLRTLASLKDSKLVPNAVQVVPAARQTHAPGLHSSSLRTKPFAAGFSPADLILHGSFLQLQEAGVLADLLAQKSGVSLVVGGPRILVVCGSDSAQLAACAEICEGWRGTLELIAGLREPGADVGNQLPALAALLSQAERAWLCAVMLSVRGTWL